MQLLWKNYICRVLCDFKLRFGRLFHIYIYIWIFLFIFIFKIYKIRLRYKIVRLRYGRRGARLLFSILHLAYVYSFGLLKNYLYKNYKYFSIDSKYSNISINYYNFWFKNKIDLDQSPINKIFEKLFSKSSKSVNIVSVFGHPLDLSITRSGINLFYSGENIEHPDHYNWYYYLHTPFYRKSFDLILNFEYCQWDNHVRVPNWFFIYVLQNYLLKIPDSHQNVDEYIYQNISTWVETCNDPKLRTNPNRTRAFSMIASHDSTSNVWKTNEFTGLRGEITALCSKLARVDCAGKLFNNTMELVINYKNNKYSYLRNYKFNICPENSNSLGYTTEKIFDSINCGCIPIYAGSKSQVEPGILNPGAFIYYDIANNTMAMAKIKDLLENETSYQKFIQIPPFLPTAVDNIFAIYQQLKRAINKICPPPPLI